MNLMTKKSTAVFQRKRRKKKERERLIERRGEKGREGKRKGRRGRKRGMEGGWESGGRKNAMISCDVRSSIPFFSPSLPRAPTLASSVLRIV